MRLTRILKSVDLRSDTVTRPCESMRKCMRTAVVGDDVYGDDESVNSLERQVATMTGKESGLFVPSGTMGNLIGLAAHCNRGDEVILGNKSHIFYYEGGGASSYMGISYHTVKNEDDGTIAISSIEDSLRPVDDHFPSTRLLALENTHNKCGGRVLTPVYMRSISELCVKHNLKFHLDGARLFNAAAHLQVPMVELVQDVHSASICLSKGLGAPVGSVLVGDADYIRKARRIRKSLGGGMRQAGLLAAAGTFAINNNAGKLVDDHSKARLFAEELSKCDCIRIDATTVETNIVNFEVVGAVSAHEVRSMLKEKHDILLNSYSSTRMRAVTHLDVSFDDVLKVAKTIVAIASS